MAAPMSAVVLRRSRRRPWANGDSARSFRARQATSGAAPSSASRRLPPLMLRGCRARTSRSSVIVPSGGPDPWVQGGGREIDDQIDDDESERGDEGEALHPLGIAGEDGGDAGRPERRQRGGGL